MATPTTITINWGDDTADTARCTSAVDTALTIHRYDRSFTSENNTLELTTSWAFSHHAREVVPGQPSVAN
ncbi:hypothetical protein [Actinomyces vulturis]|uniref:hypothetical protein n=1 Tax=Actinomyces vulturis TaxID=1857645 RepID=UPI00083636B1|nr:hypothetical protein [Actinomyces vulturis]